MNDVHSSKCRCGCGAVGPGACGVSHEGAEAGGFGRLWEGRTHTSPACPDTIPFPVCVLQVYIRIKDDEWNVYRRYAEFRSLHQKLQNKYQQVRTFNFPPKKAIGNKVFELSVSVKVGGKTSFISTQKMR